MSTYYEEKVVDPPVGDPIPFKLNYSPRAYELPGQPISVDKSGTVAARQVGGGVPRKPFRVTAITEAAKPATVTAGALPEKPFSISVLTSVDAPDSVTVVAAPRKPNTVSVQADPIKPASVTADAMPFAPTSVVAESDPKQPISVDADYIPHAPAIVEVNAMPIAPVGVAAFSDPKKPISVDADYIPYAPSSVDADYIPHAPSVVSVNADPKQPLTVDADYIPYAPAPVSAGQVPTVPSLVEAGLIPEAPSTVSVLAAPRQPSLAYAFSPFVVEIMETEAEITTRPASTPEGTVAFGTDTKMLYVFNKTGVDSWGAFAPDLSYQFDKYSIKTNFEYPVKTGYFGAVLSKKYASSGAQEFTHSGGIAFASWFKIDEHNNDSHIFSLSYGVSSTGAWHQTAWGSNISFITTSVQNKLSFRMGGVSSSIGDIEYGKWHHIVFSWIGDTVVDSNTSSGNCKVYLDGQTIFDDTKITNLNFQGSTFPFVINTNAFPTGGWVRNFEGNVSELAVWNRPLTNAEAVSLYENGVPQLLDLNPTAWWRMGDGSEEASGTVIENVVGDGYQGNLVPVGLEPITVSYEEDAPNDFIPFNRSATYLNGSSSYITSSATLGSTSQTTCTYSAWIKTSNTSSSMAFFSTSGPGSGSSTKELSLLRPTNGNFYIIIRNSQYSYLNNAVGSTISGDTNICDDLWHHIALVVDGTSFKIYIDGGDTAINASNTSNSSGPAFSGTSTVSFVGSTHQIYLGKNGTHNSYFWEGGFDEVAFFRSALSDSDIRAIYNNGVPASLSDYSPFQWLRMGEYNVLNGVTPDQGSGGNHATLINAVPQNY